LEDGAVAEFFIEREAHRGVVRNIYKGRVTRVLPGMQSAFVDLGLERDAFLYVTDVFEDLDENLLSPEEQVRNAPIEERLQEGQEVLAQVVKEPLGTKGARITTHVSLPGRYLVFMPTVEHVGVSRKIVDDEERRRLKSMLKEIRQERGGGGFIARTAGLGRSREDFDRDARYLTRTWDEVRAVSCRQAAPVLLHRELGLVQRLLRDILSDNVGAIRLDSERDYQSTLELVRELQPELAARVHRFEEGNSRQKVMAALEQELSHDRSPSKLLSVNEFGLVILTRKRVKQSLERILCQPCPYCVGSGMIKSVATVCSEIYDEVKKLASD